MVSVQKRLGRRIRVLREQKGVTQEKFAEMANMGAQYISALERGTKNATLEVLERIASALNVDMFVLFAFDSLDDKPTRQTVKKVIDSVPESDLLKVIQVISILVADHKR